MNALSRLACVLMVSVGLHGCGSPYYTADSIEAWVVDADTGQPIEGAVVTANWQLLAGSFDTGGRKLRQLEVKETVTDSNGRFYFPGFTRLNVSLDQLGEEDPQILIFKPGYRYYRATNDYPVGGESPGTHRTASITGKKLQIRRADADPRKQAYDLDFIGANLMTIADSGDSSRVQTMLRALSCERLRLKAIDPTVLISIPGNYATEKDCATS